MFPPVLRFMFRSRCLRSRWCQLYLFFCQRLLNCGRHNSCIFGHLIVDFVWSDDIAGAEKLLDFLFFLKTGYFIGIKLVRPLHLPGRSARKTKRGLVAACRMLLLLRLGLFALIGWRSHHITRALLSSSLLVLKCRAT